MAVTCEISLKSWGFHRYNLTFQQQFPPSPRLSATAQPKCIRTGRAQEPHGPLRGHLHPWAMLLKRSDAGRDQDPLCFRVNPTQPADPHGPALPAPRCSPARAERPDGIFGLRPRLCLQHTEVRPKYYTLRGVIQNLYVRAEWVPKRASLQQGSAFLSACL